MTARTDLQGRRALVTGGASGIGKGTARRLVEHGADVVVGDIDEDRGRSVAAELGAAFTVLDVADPAGWDRVVSTSGPFDIAFLNAGVSTNSGNAPGEPQGFDLDTFPVVEMADSAYRRIMSINVDGVVFGTRALLPLMFEAGRGDIVVTASMAGLAPELKQTVREQGLEIMAPEHVGDVVVRAVRERVNGAQWVIWPGVDVAPYDWNPAIRLAEPAP